MELTEEEQCASSKPGQNLTLYRPGDGTIYILKNRGPTFFPVYAHGYPGLGIGGFGLSSSLDRVFSFDFTHNGHPDHLVLYRPGSGIIWILKNTLGLFNPVYRQGNPANGIGGYDLQMNADRILAFDFESSGKLDYLVSYRPGTGKISILKNNYGSFTPVYAQGSPGNGIGTYDLKSPADRIFAFDYDHSGKLDHLVLYRPGGRPIYILKNENGKFTPVYKEYGIGGYDLAEDRDRVLSFDYEHTGKMDHLVLYRRGARIIYILKNDNGKFSQVCKLEGCGIGGYDLGSGADRIFAFDYKHVGKQDHLAIYRPGTGTMWILENNNGIFSPIYQSGQGIGGYDLKSPADRIFTFDYSSGMSLINRYL